MKKLEEVIKLYNKNFQNKKEYKKVIWGSKLSMLNRYKLFFRLIKKQKYVNWIDIGSGTGMLFKKHDKTNIKVENRYGLEVNKKLFLFSKKRKFKKNVVFLNKDLINLETNIKFDLVSLIGVLQNCGYSYKKIISKISKIMSKNSFIFLTSKNIKHNMLNENFCSKSGHEWFDPVEISRYLKKKGIKVLKIGGFNPTKCKIVKLNSSSTFFIYGKNIR